MGVLYLGALPFAILVAGALKGVLWAREVALFHDRFRRDAALRARRRDTLLPPRIRSASRGSTFFRRPADAAFFVGAMGSDPRRLSRSSRVRRDLPAPWLALGYGRDPDRARGLRRCDRDGIREGHAARSPRGRSSTSAFCLAGALALLSILPSVAQRRPDSRDDAPRRCSSSATSPGTTVQANRPGLRRKPTMSFVPTAATRRSPP